MFAFGCQCGKPIAYVRLVLDRCWSGVGVSSKDCRGAVKQRSKHGGRRAGDQTVPGARHDGVMSELELLLGICAVAATVAIVWLAYRLGSRAGGPHGGLLGADAAPGVAEFRQEAAGIGVALDQVADALTAQRLEFRERHAALDERMAAASEVHAAVERHARSIGAALANPVARGAWGERMIDDLLRHAGMIEGVNFVRQPTLASGHRPDVAVLLPGGRRLHIDVKFPADNYLRWCDATDDEQRSASTRAFLADVRRRVGELAPRRYTDPNDALTFVVLFMPNEAIFRFAHEHDPGLIDFSIAKGVVLCSPYSLFSVLAVVRETVELDSMNQRAAEVLRSVNGLRAEWTRFVGALGKVDAQIDVMRRTFDSVAGTRVRQLDRAFEELAAQPSEEPAAGGSAARARSA